MSKYEERAYNVGRSKPNIAGMKNQLARLKHDLEQFTARKPDGAVAATLKERVKELEATIFEAEASKARETQAAKGPADDGDEEIVRPERKATTSRSASYSTASHFPPRGRSGR